MYKKISNIVSAVFSPFLVPTYAIAIVLWMSILFVVPLSSKLTVTGVTFGLTALIPFSLVFAMYRLKAVKSVELTERAERLLPYLLAVVCYSFLAVYYHLVHSPIWLTMFAVAGGLTVLVTLIINRWWKISAHSAAMGALTMFVYLLFKYQLLMMGSMPLLYTMIILTVLVGTARIILGHHTPMQVLAGVANGAVCVLLSSLVY